MVFINALDDPIVPDMLLEPIKEHASMFMLISIYPTTITIFLQAIKKFYL